MKYYQFELVSPTNYYFEADSAWEKSLNQNVKFNCGHWRNYPAKPVDIIYSSEYSKLASLAFVRMRGNLVYCVRGGLFRFLNSIFGDLTYMRLYGLDGKANSEWRSIWNSHSDEDVTIRGSVGSTLNFCQKCGHRMYYPVPPYNIVAGNFEFREVHVTADGLLVRSEIADGLRELRLKGVAYSPVNMVKAPVDGFSLDFQTVAPEEPIK